MPSPNTKSAGAMILDLLTSKTVKNKCLLLRSHPVPDIVTAAQMAQDRWVLRFYDNLLKLDTFRIWCVVTTLATGF